MDSETTSLNPKVEIKDLTKVFGKNKKKALNLLDQGKSKEEILDETGVTVGVNKANLEIYPGEIFVIMGLSGSGKSTLVRMINRLIEPTSGSVIVDGEDISEMDDEQLREVRRKKISMVFQNFGLFPHKTILQNAEYGLEVQGIDEDERQKRAETALDNSGLLAYKDQYPDQLSGGMQQRVGLARALANDPDILLMDEAFSALDPLIRHDMQDELMNLQATDRRTVIFITHDLNESLRIGDRIAIMRNGEIVQVGTGEEILMNPANDYVRQFVEDVDRARVYTAENIMESPQPLVEGRHGPRVALQTMEADNLVNSLVVDSENHLLGYVTDDDIAKAVRDKKPNFTGIIREDMPRVSPDTLIQDMYDFVHDSVTPIAVVDEDGTLKGIVVRRTILEALAKENEEGVGIADE